ncbi:MAG: hypothetical protein ABIS03_06385 [Gemmatimonadaceae bacterium]
MERAFESHGRGVAAAMGVVVGLAVGGLLLGMFRVSGGTHETAAHGFIAFVALAAGFSVYQAAQLSKAERWNRPRRIKSTPLAAGAAAVVYGVFAFGFNFLVLTGDPVEWRAVRSMTLLFMLMGGVTAWRRRENPGKGLRHEGISVLIVFAVWLPIVLIMRKAFG